MHQIQGTPISCTVHHWADASNRCLTVDFNKKTLHLSWHPESAVAIAGLNNLFIYSV